MGCSTKTFIDPPPISPCMAWIILIVNIFAPGIGTMLVGFFHCSCENFLIGILQLVLAPIIIGWVWSIWWGCELINVSKNMQLGV